MFTDGTYEIIGAAMRVHRELGPGLREIAYQRALALEFSALSIAHRREIPIPLWYRGVNIGTFRADFEVNGKLLLEVKVAPLIAETAVAQVAHYLKSTGLPLALILNFASGGLQVRRVKPRVSMLTGPHQSNSLDFVRGSLD